jgi:hypothetical protein
LQYAIGRQPDRVADALSFEEFVDLGIGESCISLEIQTLYDAPVPGNYRLQQRVPVAALCNYLASACIARHRRID